MMTLIADILLNLRTPNMLLDMCLKSLVSEDPGTSNMVNGLKHCWKLNDSTFTISLNPNGNNSGWENLSDLYIKSQNCLLTPWVPIISILFLTEGIYCYIFKCKYLRNKKYFVNFFLTFSKFRFNFELFQKKGEHHHWRIFFILNL